MMNRHAAIANAAARAAMQHAMRGAPPPPPPRFALVEPLARNNDITMLDGDYFVLLCIGDFVDNVTASFGENERKTLLTTPLYREKFERETRRRVLAAEGGERLAAGAQNAQRGEDDLRRSALEASYAQWHALGGAQAQPAPARPEAAPDPILPPFPPAGSAVNALGFVDTTFFRGVALPRILYNYATFSVTLRLFISPDFIGALSKVLSFIQASREFDAVLGGAPLLEMIASPTVAPMLATLVACELLFARNRAVRGSMVTVAARRELVLMERQARQALYESVERRGDVNTTHWRAPAVEATMAFPYRDPWRARR